MFEGGEYKKMVEERWGIEFGNDNVCISNMFNMFRLYRLLFYFRLRFKGVVVILYIYFILICIKI